LHEENVQHLHQTRKLFGEEVEPEPTTPRTPITTIATGMDFRILIRLVQNKYEAIVVRAGERRILMKGREELTPGEALQGLLWRTCHVMGQDGVVVEV